MDTLISLAVRRPVTVIMLFLCLLLLGGISLFNLDLELLPEMSLPKITVSTSYPGLPPAEIRELITIPLENALAAAQSLRTISSVSREGHSLITMEFHWGTNLVRHTAEAREIIDICHPYLPSGVEKPLINAVDPNEEPVMCVGLLPKAGDLSFARRIAEGVIRSRLQQVRGVGSVDILGGNEEEIQVLVDQSKAAMRRCTPQQVAGMLAETNLCFPVGTLTEGNIAYPVKADGRVGSPEELGELLLIDEESGTRFRLEEIAEIRWEKKERDSLFQIDGREGVGLLIHRQGGVSPVKLSANVNRVIDSLKASYEKDIDVIIARDSSELIKRSIEHLALAAAIGAAAAFLVLLLFLKDIALSIIVILSVPVSILTALLLLKLAGRSLNIMSLGGLALGIGMLVDNSIVILENLTLKHPSGTLDYINHTISRTREMASSTLGSTLTTLVVFLPVIFLPGIIGALFSDLALAVIFSVGTSYFVSITLVPVLFALLIKSSKSTAEKAPGCGIFSKLQRAYGLLIRRLAKKPFVLFASVFIIFLIGAGLLFRVKAEYLPKIDTGEIQITLETLPGFSMDSLSTLQSELSYQLLRISGVSRVFSTARSDSYRGTSYGGVAGDGDQAGYGNRALISVLLKERNRPPAKELQSTISELLTASQLKASAQLPDSILSPLLGVDAEGWDILVFGATPAEALAEARHLQEDIQTRSKDLSARVYPDGVKAEISVAPRRDVMARAGISPAQVAQFLSQALKGTYATRVEVGERDIDVRVLVRREDRSSIEKIRDLTLTTSAGSRQPIGELASIEKEERTPYLMRSDRQDTALIRIQGGTGDLKEMREAVSAVTRDNENAVLMQRSVFQQHLPQILLCFSLSVLLLYFVLGAQLESFLLPLLLMLSFPLSFSGILIALTSTNSSINLSSALGIIVLLGISVNNAIILFETYRRGIHPCADISAAIQRGSTRRLRPIIMTMITTIAALLPIAIDPWQKSTQSSLAIAIIGGLLFSTLLSLFVIPMVFLTYLRKKYEASS